MALGKNVKRRREEFPWTQQDLATAAGVRQQTIGNMETRDSASSIYLLQIANALHLQTDQLLSGKWERWVGPPPLVKLPETTADELGTIPAQDEEHSREVTNQNSEGIEMHRGENWSILAEQVKQDFLTLFTEDRRQICLEMQELARRTEQEKRSLERRRLIEVVATPRKAQQ